MSQGWALLSGDALANLGVSVGSEEPLTGYSNIVSAGYFPFSNIMADLDLMSRGGMEHPRPFYGNVETGQVTYEVNPDEAFDRWAKAGNGIALKQISRIAFQVCTVNAQGKQSGPIQVYTNLADHQFGIAMSIVGMVFGAMTGGAFTAGQAAVNSAGNASEGNYQGAVLNGVKAYGGYSGGAEVAASAASATGETAMMAIQFGDVETSYDFGGLGFDSFNYSDGESLMVFSDAQIVDFGFDPGLSTAPFSPDYGVGFDLSQEWSNHASPVYGSTFESTVGDFGSQNYNFGAVGDSFSKLLTNGAVSAAVKKAVPNKSVVAQNTGQNRPKSSGDNFTMGNFADAIKTLGTTAREVAGLKRQGEMPVKTYGQLQPSPKTAASGEGPNVALLAIGAAVAGAFLFFA